MLENNKLLIDQDCPMCAAYGAGFTKFGLIDPQTVSPYQYADSSLARRVDMDRARSEIALYDQTTDRTVYGIDAMIAIVSHQRPRLRQLLHGKPLYYLLRQLYAFISYNRKVIYPAAPRFGRRDCTPPLHRTYRWLYILLTALFTGFILNRYVYLINEGWSLAYNPVREYLICFGQIAWQGAIVGWLAQKQTLTYLGNMSTVSLVGAILLSPMLLLSTLVSLSPMVLLAYFLLVVGLMLREHLRRCQALGLPLGITASWIIFRTFVLAIVLTTVFL